MFTHAKTPVGNKRPRPSAPVTPFTPLPTPYAAFASTPTPSTPNADTSLSYSSYTSQPNTSIYSSQALPSTPQARGHILPVTPIPTKPEVRLSHSTERYTLDTYGPLPNAVKSALSRLTDVSVVSGSFIPQGYAWVVVDFTLYVWEFTLGANAVCHQLEFPTSRSYPNADLAAVLRIDGKVCAVAITAEGVVRLWPRIQDPSVYSETTIKITTEASFTRLAVVDPFGLVAGTSGGSNPLYWITTQPLTSRPFKVGSFWDYWSTKKYPAVRALIPGTRSNNSRDFYVLTASSVQKWEVSYNQEKLVQDFALHSAVEQDLLNKDGAQAQVWLLDAKLSNHDKLYVLSANSLLHYPQDRVPLINYTIAVVDTQSNMELERNLHITAHTPKYEVKNQQSLLERARIELPNGGHAAYVIWQDTVVACTVPRDSRPQDKIPLQNAILIGSGSHDNQALLASERLGVVRVIQHGVDDEIYDDEDVMEDSEMVDLPVARNSLEALRAAWKNYAVDLRASNHYVSQIGLDLSDAVERLSFSIVDSPPSVDPHWAEDHADKPVNDTQLHSKRRKHNKLKEFLNDGAYGRLWDKLTPVAQQTITEHSELINAALYLKTFQADAKDMRVLLSKITHTLELRKVDVRGTSTSPQDLFYTDISKLPDILLTVEEYIKAGRPSVARREARATVDDLWESNQIFISIISALSEPTLNRRREIFGSTFTLRDLVEEYLYVVADFLKLDLADKDKEIFDQVFSLTTSALNAHEYEQNKEQYTSDKLSHFEVVRSRVIDPFLATHKQQALELSEKYQYFGGIVRVCEDIKDKSRLFSYMSKFKSQGLPQYVFRTLYESKRFYELLTLPDEFDEEFKQFILPYSHLSWIHLVKGQHYKNATDALVIESAMEGVLANKKVLLSLAKLSLLAHNPASTETRDFVSIKEQLYMVKVQEQFVPDINEPLQPADLLNIMIERGREDWLLYALDALQNTATLLSTEVRTQILQSIWERAFRQEDWKSAAHEWHMGHIEEQGLFNFLRNTRFYIATSLDRFRGLLPPPMLEKIITNYNEENKTIPSLLRVLQQTNTILLSTMATQAPLGR